MEPGFLNVTVTPNAQAMPVAMAAQAATLLAYNAGELQCAIRELARSNPMVEPLDNEDLYDRIAFIPARRETLADHLATQLRIMVSDPELLHVCLLLANSLDENGYLREDEENLCRDFNCDAALFRVALERLQTLDPVGVGARNLSECLQLQLMAMEPINHLALTIAQTHLEALAYGTLALEGADEEEVETAVALIRSLEPRPGRAFDYGDTVFVVPDIAVSREDGVLTVSLVNQPHLPALIPQAMALLDMGTPHEKRYMQEQLSSARNFLHAVKQRNSTLLTVAAYAVQQQTDHLMNPEGCPLKRLTQSDTAAMLGINVSTVSRAVSDKYLEFEHRVIPLRSLFTTGGSHRNSKEEIMSRILDICRQSQQRPSDNTIAQMLAEEGISISRRTVSKYRHALMDGGGFHR